MEHQYPPPPKSPPPPPPEKTPLERVEHIANATVRELKREKYQEAFMLYARARLAERCAHAKSVRSRIEQSRAAVDLSNALARLEICRDEMIPHELSPEEKAIWTEVAEGQGA